MQKESPRQTMQAEKTLLRSEVDVDGHGQRGKNAMFFLRRNPMIGDDGDVVLPKMGTRRALGRCTSLLKEI